MPAGRKALGLGVAVALVLGALALGASSFGAGAAKSTPPTRRAAYVTTLPEGAGHDLAQRSCLTCHSAMLMTQQHKDSTAWEKTVRQMEAWGVQTTPAEHETLMVYLGRNFGPKTPK